MKRFLKKSICVEMAVILCISCFFISGSALTVRYAEASVTDTEDNTSAEELYLNKLFYGSDANIQTLSQSGDKILSGEDKRIYDMLYSFIAGLAENGGKTELVLDGKDPFVAQFTGATIQEAVQKLMQAFGRIALAVRNDEPENFYWLESGQFFGINYSYSGTKIHRALFYFPVEPSYRKNDERNEIDSVKMQRAREAKQNAQQIAQCIQNISCLDREKLSMIKDEICDLTGYASEAAQSNYTGGNDPWQIVHVFDKNPDTNVVCEGYAKAFQYLCDLVFPYDEPECYCVTGWMSTDKTKRGGLHMWNVVRIADENFLVDVTNCDSGTVGCGLNKKNEFVPGDRLFMRNMADGKVSKEMNTYCVVTGEAKGSNDTYIPSRDVYYEYDTDTSNLYSPDLIGLERRTPSYIVGDTDGDGTVKISDYTALVNLAKNPSAAPQSSSEKNIFDLNRDNAIDAFDAALLDRIIM